MSRSRKTTSIVGIAAESEKRDKRTANRRLRRKTTSILREGDSREIEVPLLREVSNVWSMGKDGKRYFDPKQHPKGMRK